MIRVPEESIAAGPGRAPETGPFRVAAAALILLAGAGILALAMSGSEAASRDYIAYWATGQQLVKHGNPYAGADLLLIERAAGYRLERPMIMRNPPTGLFLALPLGLVSVRVGAVVWSLALIAALMMSIRMLWIMHGRPRDRLHLVGYLFPPVLACLLAGQIGAFLLLGVTLFLYLQRSRPYFAGASLLLCLLKPHLFLPFGLVLLIWIAVRKAYPILIGTGGAVMASLALILILDPSIWMEYAHGEKAEHIQNLFIPCLSSLLRLVIHRGAAWIQLLPVCAGCVWGMWYFWSRREGWSWTNHGLLLLMVSLAVAPYAWFTDEVILLLAILGSLYRASNAGRSLLPFGCVAGAALIEVLTGISLPSGLYLWTMPAWLAWYLYAVRGTDKHFAAVVQVSGERSQLEQVHLEAR